jgi:hypothetical protein
MKNDKVRTTKIGTNRGKARVWLQGDVLTEAGFKRGMKYTVIITVGELLITLDKDGDRHVSGKPGIPIIDINTPKLEEVAPMGTRLAIRSEAGALTLTPVKGEN